MAKLSIITPTYNRAHTLPRCFESLCQQTCKDFEWIIVDDGSSDNTQSVISSFYTDAFLITKVQKGNGGKHTALNTAHSYINGDYVLILDSDDFLTDTAVEEVLRAWAVYDSDNKIGVVTFLRADTNYQPLCVVDKYETPVDFLPVNRKIIISSDCCEVIRTSLFMQFPFPVFPGEKFISECALWNRVGQHYKCVYINSVIYVCKYLEGGLTNSGRKMRIRNPKGGMFTSNLRMDWRNSLKERLKAGLLFTCYGCFAHIGIRQQMKESDYPLLTALCYPFGFLLYLWWKRKYS